MKKIVATLACILFSSLLFLVSCDDVYITRTGKYYHQEKSCWCIQSSRTKRKVSLDKAKERYLPCPYCIKKEDSHPHIGTNEVIPGDTYYHIDENCKLEDNLRFPRVDLAVAFDYYELAGCPVCVYNTTIENDLKEAGLHNDTTRVKGDCPVTEPRRLVIGFDIMSTDLHNALPPLQDFVDHYEGEYLEVIGYASPEGGPETNQKLSFERAKAVKEALTKLGIPDSLMEVRGVGGTADFGPFPEINRAVIVTVK